MHLLSRLAFPQSNAWFLGKVVSVVMELRQLEYFVAVAEEGTFTRAAERVHISQSGVSAQIQQLERELGAPLFERTPRRATLTPAGEAALVHARAVLASAVDVGR